MPAGALWMKRCGMCIASDKDCSDPADIQPIELTKAKIPLFINSQAVGDKEREKTRFIITN